MLWFFSSSFQEHVLFSDLLLCCILFLFEGCMSFLNSQTVSEAVVFLLPCVLICLPIRLAGWRLSISCVRHFSNCDHLSPSSFLRTRHLQSLPACSEPASWWGSGVVVRRDLAVAKESTSPPGVSSWVRSFQQRCVLWLFVTSSLCRLLARSLPVC